MPRRDPRRERADHRAWSHRWLRDSSNPWETCAFAYYDAIRMVSDDVVSPVDVVATAALHSGLSKNDLAFFVDERDRLSGWLGAVPFGVPLHELDDNSVVHVAGISSWPEAHLSLLTKVLHRERPDAIPLLERLLIDLYRPLTGERAAAGRGPRLFVLYVPIW